MKINFTNFYCLVFITGAMLLSGNLFAQSLINVTVSNNVFTPSNIVVNAGDTVKWTNTQGNHNVNGTTATFPSNPETFGNAVAGPGWVLTHVFNTVGSYSYQCDVHVSLNMVGTVTVQTTTGIENNNILNVNAIANVYPIPANDYLIVAISKECLNQYAELSLVVYDLKGSEVQRIENANRSNIKVDTKNLPGTSYLLKLISNTEVIDSRKIVIE